MPTPPSSALKKLIDGPLNIPGPMLGEKGKLDPHFQQDASLQDALETMLHANLPANSFDSKDNKMPAKKCLYGFAVVDLTADPAKPSYAGWNDTYHLYIASLAKLLALYGMFQLRSDLRGLAALGISNLPELIQNTVYRLRSLKITTTTQPDINNFFKFNGTKVELTSDPKSNADLAAIYNGTVNRVGVKARELLRLMAGWSDNNAASLCIRALGFDYLWALSKRSGLYRDTWDTALGRNNPKSPQYGGLFLSRDYAGVKWTNPPSNTPPLGNFHAGNARSLATLMSMIAAEALVDRDAHANMLEMLRKEVPSFEPNQTITLPDGSTKSLGRGEWSPIGTSMYKAYTTNPWKANQTAWDYDVAVPPANPSAPLAAAKIGFITGKCISDALIIRNVRPLAAGGTIPITAILIAINCHDGSLDLLNALGTSMAKKLDELHGGITS